ncbi:9700_t:CDS:2 [Dentiscutata erythropus]|uniref:9700_t:CDS:1 n=1 Tax=Dentiscutata erythropus TaxID=1348616 RepID=A0A9N8WQW5_9GLOM|nr:9700_t:CDS:2 [Dentiscutata erythropus]
MDWCKSAVPILWKQPFMLTDVTKPSDKIINVYSKFLSDDVRAMLMIQGLKLPDYLLPTYYDTDVEMNDSDCNSSSYNNIHSTKNRFNNSLFYYPCFLRKFKYETFILCLEQWYTEVLEPLQIIDETNFNLKNTSTNNTLRTRFARPNYHHTSSFNISIPSASNDTVSKTSQYRAEEKQKIKAAWCPTLSIEFFKIFLAAGIKLDLLDLQFQQCYSTKNVDHLRVIPMLPNARASLSNLVEFMPKGVDDETYEQYYSKICRKIKTLKLQDLNTGNLGAISLISSQFSLEHIVISNYSSYMAGNAIHKILAALESQAPYMKSVEIRNSFIQDNHIPSKEFCWPELEELRIVNNDQNLVKMPLGVGPFPKLKKIFISQQFIPVDLEQLLKNTLKQDDGTYNFNDADNVNNVNSVNKESNDGSECVYESSLTHINLNIQIHSVELSTILRTIATHCSQNLLHFDSTIDFHSIPLLFTLLQSCQKLESLSIWNPFFNQYTEDDYRMLVSYFPKTLKKFVISTMYKDISYGSLKILLKEMSVKLDVLGLGSCKKLDHRSVEIIGECAKENSRNMPRKIIFNQNNFEFWCLELEDKFLELQTMANTIKKLDRLYKKFFKQPTIQKHSHIGLELACKTF